uniref:(P)ppGpp synthetase n=1 Tax=Thermogemmatispora argillosa TaxID=2045280 RepID=A0A455T3G3_9CHLR|nr:(p)ppGpp synthetase [Thermogemmatispora argillosa]
MKYRNVHMVEMTIEHESDRQLGERSSVFAAGTRGEAEAGGGLTTAVGEKPPDERVAEVLLARVQEYMSPTEIEQVQRALRLAQEHCRGVRGKRALPPLEHALGVALILAEMRIDAIGVAAGLIFEAVDAELLSLERVTEELGRAVARVVNSMLRLNILERKKQVGAQLLPAGRSEVESSRESRKRRNRDALQHQQAETVRKMFLAMSDDPRVVLLKLAYRLHAMRMLRDPAFQYDPQERLTMARETREIYAPLAGRLGMSRVECELEDLAFEILQPAQYAWVRDQMEAEKKQWGAYVEKVCEILRREMASIGLKRVEVSGRIKHLFSFYKKILRAAGLPTQPSLLGTESLEDLKRGLDLNQIHDVIAFRILVETTQDCYLALGHIHSLWKPKEGRIKDYIANPKPNGYQALHTTVFCLDDQLVEIQIRTFEMHQIAEYGVAMHWHYKDVGDHASPSAKELLTWLRQLAEWQRELRASQSGEPELPETSRNDPFSEQIFVFTPKGEVKDLPVGSTPIDFAYRIHSEIGNHCAGARIITEIGDGEGERLVARMVPLDYELKNGEIVDITTSRTAHPSRDWLNFARTATARSHIRRYLKAHERDINIQIGRERLDRELKALGVRGLEALTEDLQDRLLEEYNAQREQREPRLSSFEDLLAAIGSDKVRQHWVAVRLGEYLQVRERERENRENGAHQEEEPLLAASSSKEAPAVSLCVDGVTGLLTRLANCCCPLPGDAIVGFISRGRGVIVHRADCPNIARYREHNGERLITVSWAGVEQSHYLAPIVMTARDRPGLMRDIASAIAELGINMAALSTRTHGSRELAVINATLEIESLEQLQRVIARLERVKDVLQVGRDLKRNRRR